MDPNILDLSAYRAPSPANSARHDDRKADEAPPRAGKYTPVRPLPKATLPPVLPYLPDMLPDVVRPWLSDEAERGQFPFDYLAVTALSAMGAAIGRRCAMYPKEFDNWYEYSNLWSAIIGRPGMMKSPSMGSAMVPLRKLETAWQTENREAEIQYAEDLEIAKIKKGAAREKAKREAKDGGEFKLEKVPPVREPCAKRLITSDATEEKLGELMSGNPMGMILELDELAALSAMIEKNPSLKEFFLKAWSGKSGHTVDRIIRGTVHIEALCLTVIGGIQPGRIAVQVRESQQGQGGDGLLQRFQLVAFPDGWNTTWRNVDRHPDQEARKRAQQWFNEITSMDPCDFPQVPGDNPAGLRFTPDAYIGFIDWYTRLQNDIRQGEHSEALEAAKSKSGKSVAGLALIHQLGKDIHSSAVDAESLAQALRLYEVSISHTRRLLASGKVAGTEAARFILSKIRERKLDGENGFTARAVNQGDWKGLTDKAAVADGIAILVEHNWLIAVDVKTSGVGGRPTVELLLNPMASDLVDGGEF